MNIGSSYGRLLLTSMNDRARVVSASIAALGICSMSGLPPINPNASASGFPWAQVPSTPAVSDTLVKVVTNPGDAVITVDGQPSGPVWPVQVAPGGAKTVTVAVTKKGYRATGLQVEISAGTTTTVFVTLDTLGAGEDGNSFVPGMKVKDVDAGSGALAVPGDDLTVDYTGKLANGTVFDSSIGKHPFTFTLGSGMVIKGWDLGMGGMQVGGTRILTIPPALGYGQTGAGNVIPPGAALAFTVHVLKIQHHAQGG
jgi:hypothetical protein